MVSRESCRGCEFARVAREVSLRQLNTDRREMANLSKFNRTVEGVYESIKSVGQELGHFSTRVTKVEKSVDEVGSKVDKLEDRVEKLEDKVDQVLSIVRRLLPSVLRKKSTKKKKKTKK